MSAIYVYLTKKLGSAIHLSVFLVLPISLYLSPSVFVSCLYRVKIDLVEMRSEGDVDPGRLLSMLNPDPNEHFA